MRKVNGRPLDQLRAATRAAVDDGRFVIELERAGEPATLEIYVLRQPYARMARS